MQVQRITVNTKSSSDEGKQGIHTITTRQWILLQFTPTATIILISKQYIIEVSERAKTVSCLYIDKRIKA